MVLTELGTWKVQGLDYAYTLQGWLKAVNGVYKDNGALSVNNDMNKDGIAAANNKNVFEYVSKDVFAFSLHYYNDKNFRDYSPIEKPNNWTNIQGEGRLGNTSKGFVSLYNGNIAAMATHIGTPQGQPQGSYGNQLLFYQYDQLNRIKNANRVTNTTDDQYAANRIERYAFDANGNITTLQRTRMNGNVTNAAQRIDNLSHASNAGDTETLFWLCLQFCVFIGSSCLHTYNLLYILNSNI